LAATQFLAQKQATKRMLSSTPAACCGARSPAAPPAAMSATPGAAPAGARVGVWVSGCACALCAHPNPDHLPSPLNSTQATSSGRTSISSVPCASAFSLPSNAWCSARLASRARSVSCSHARVREALRSPLCNWCKVQPA